jgi:hypothetical protein
MPLVDPLPSWAMLIPQRVCGCCRNIAVKMAYTPRPHDPRSYTWLCPRCDLTAEPLLPKEP